MALINDGFATTVEFSQAPSGFLLLIEETGVTPFGIDGGDPIDTTSMRRTTWRTAQPRALKTLTPLQEVVKYDVACFAEILAMININQQVTLTYPDDKTLIAWGFIKSFTPQELREGGIGLATIVVIPTNQNDSGEEVAPSGTAVSS